MHSVSVYLAYIDPGTGAVVLQFLIAGIAGIAIFFRGAVGKFLGFFGIGKSSSDADEDEAEE